MSSFSDRAREQLIERLGDDPRLGKAKVLSATPLIRGSIVAMMLCGIVGAIALQAIFGGATWPFFAGLVLGYGAYIVFKVYTMGEPRIVAAMAALTRDKLILLGSKRVGIAAEWKRKDIDIDVLRKGNILVMGKIAVVPKGADPVTFFLSNRNSGRHLVATFNEQRKR